LDPSRKNSPVFIQFAKPIPFAQLLENAAIALDDIFKWLRVRIHLLLFNSQDPFAKFVENASSALDDIFEGVLYLKVCIFNPS